MGGHNILKKAMVSMQSRSWCARTPLLNRPCGAPKAAAMAIIQEWNIVERGMLLLLVVVEV